MSRDTKKMVYIILAACIALAFLSFAAWRGLQRAPRGTAPPSAPQEENTAGVVIPPEVRAYNGIVKEAKDGEFVLQSSSSENYLAKDALLTVLYDDNTQFVKQSVSATIPKGVSVPAVVEAAASFTDVEIGARIIAYARQNIAGAENFLADKIIIFDLFHSQVQ